MRHRTFSYGIDYVGADGRRRGREACRLTMHADGGRTLTARSEIFDSQVLRDVTYRVDRAFLPLDAYVRVDVAGAFKGAAFFRFGAPHSECSGHGAREGEFVQRMAVAAPPRSFISHAVSGDVWHGAGVEKRFGRSELIEPILTASPLHNGASCPMLGRWPLRAVYLGEEEVAVPAGTFRAERIRYEEPDGALFLDTWCTPDERRIMLKMFYPPYDSSYLLTDLAEV